VNSLHTMHCMSPGQGLFGFEETSEIDTLSGYLLTLVEQRRELQKHILNQVVRSTTDAVTAPQVDTAPLTQEVLHERKTTQLELLQLPQQTSGVHEYDAVQRLARPAAPRSGDSEHLVTDSEMHHVWWSCMNPVSLQYVGDVVDIVDTAAAHFQRRHAALQHEHRRVLRALCAVQESHLTIPRGSSPQHNECGDAWSRPDHLQQQADELHEYLQVSCRSSHSMEGQCCNARADLA
jgi:hypothetical protein